MLKMRGIKPSEGVGLVDARGSWLRAKYFHCLLVVCYAVLLSGCVTTQDAAQADLSAVQAGRKSVVLFRVTAEIERGDKRVHHGIPFEATLAAMDHGGMVKYWDSENDYFDKISPSSGPGREGWRCLILDPGTYQFKITAGDQFAKGDSLPYCLIVPAGKPVVYAGSFDFDEVPSTLGAWKKFITSSPNNVLLPRGVSNEWHGAQTVAAASLGQSGGVTPSLPVVYGELSEMAVNFTNHQISKVEPGGKASLSSGDVGAGANRSVAGPIAGPLLVAGFVSIAAADADKDQNVLESRRDVRDDFVTTMAGVAAILVAAPIVIAVDKTFGEAARKKWAPYEAQLKAELDQFNLEQRLACEAGDRLSSALPGGGGTNHIAGGPDLVVQIEPYRVQLRETRRKMFALEIAVQVKLVDAGSMSVLWTHDYVYTDARQARAASDFLITPFETLIDAQSPPHHLEDYEQPAGVVLFHHELDDAVQVIGGDVAGRFKGAGFSLGSSPVAPKLSQHAESAAPVPNI